MRILVSSMLAFLVGTCFVANASALDAKQMIQMRLNFVAKHSLEKHWFAVASYIGEYLNRVAVQLSDDADEIEAEFDYKHFMVLVQNLKMKLSMPSVSTEDKDTLMQEIAPYLKDDGYLEKVITALTTKLGSVKSEEQQIAKILINAQYIQTALQSIKDTLDEKVSGE